MLPCQQRKELTVRPHLNQIRSSSKKRLILRGFYKNGKRDGEFFFYQEQLKKISEEDLDNNSDSDESIEEKKKISFVDDVSDKISKTIQTSIDSIITQITPDKEKQDEKIKEQENNIDNNSETLINNPEIADTNDESDKLDTTLPDKKLVTFDSKK